MQPNLRLSRLRDIGWKHWDPIGLLPEGCNWKDESFADEYDVYLTHAAGQLRRGVSEQEVVEYLCMIETDFMGLGSSQRAEARAWKVVKAIQADPDLWLSS